MQKSINNTKVDWTASSQFSIFMSIDTDNDFLILIGYLIVNLNNLL